MSLLGLNVLATEGKSRRPLWFDDRNSPASEALFACLFLPSFLCPVFLFFGWRACKLERGASGKVAGSFKSGEGARTGTGPGERQPKATPPRGRGVPPSPSPVQAAQLGMMLRLRRLSDQHGRQRQALNISHITPRSTRRRLHPDPGRRVGAVGQLPCPPVGRLPYPTWLLPGRLVSVAPNFPFDSLATVPFPLLRSSPYVSSGPAVAVPRRGPAPTETGRGGGGGVTESGRAAGRKAP